MKIKFRDIRLSKANLQQLDVINAIISEYQAAGYVLTLRQLYYQLVSRGIIPNLPAEYGKVGKLLKEGRMGGVVDWDAIEDRVRKSEAPPSWDSPQEIVVSASKQYAKPRMAGQKNYLEVWVEKDALSGVLKKVTEKYHVPIMVNRGYSSVSAMYDAFMRFCGEGAYKERPVKILYLGDFDPSGLDMIRDIRERIEEFQLGYNDGTLVEDMLFYVEPIALTMKQIQDYNPPPNPAKVTDSRADEYIGKYGNKSWEVDALRPEVLNDLLDEAILNNIDIELYHKIVATEARDKVKIAGLVSHL